MTLALGWTTTIHKLTGACVHKNILNQGLSETEFYGDLVYKIKKIMGTDFSDQFRKVIIRYKRNGYTLNATVCMLRDYPNNG